ncbi:uncharacterized protein Dere_GG26148 [Drosophila erecta]|uniref:Uncharacterized protein n=1 Tax=Drosophila erecta TaxID=7220 RepID=A0A0Q5VWG0_DROER|nr:uncharacterized protein Dere_GG26148 [Drosophila erecta]
MTQRTKFIINTSVEYFSARLPGSELDEQTAMILEFLEQEELTVISAVHSSSDGKIRFHHRIPSEELCLLFYKVPQVGHNHKEGGSEPLLGILTLEGGMVKSIYNSVSRVFSPSANSARRSEYGPELSGILENLHQNLGSSLGLPQSGGLPSTKINK